MVGTSYTDLHFFTPVNKKQRKPSAILLLPPCSVQLQHCEDSDTFSACWVILVVAVINFYTVKTRTFQCMLGYFGNCHDQLLHCEDWDTFSAYWVILVASMINFYTVKTRTLPVHAGLFWLFPWSTSTLSQSKWPEVECFFPFSFQQSILFTFGETKCTNLLLHHINNDIIECNSMTNEVHKLLTTWH